MSKIPQGEWTAIAARYTQGESISAIARTYGCTPPAIHYILENNRYGAAQLSDQQAHEPRRPSPIPAEIPQKQATSVELFKTHSGPAMEANAAATARHSLSLPAAPSFSGGAGMPR